MQCTSSSSFFSWIFLTCAQQMLSAAVGIATQTPQVHLKVDRVRGKWEPFDFFVIYNSCYTTQYFQLFRIHLPQFLRANWHVSASVSEAWGSYKNGVIAFPLSKSFVSNSEDEYDSSRSHDSLDDSSTLMPNNVIRSCFDVISSLRPKTEVFLNMATLRCLSRFHERFSRDWELYDCNWAMQWKIQGMQHKRMHKNYIVNFGCSYPLSWIAEAFSPGFRSFSRVS